MTHDNPPDPPLNNRDQSLADFRKAHRDFLEALETGDYAALGNAIDRESAAISEHTRAIEQYQALLRPLFDESRQDASEADVRVGDIIVRATGGTGFIVARCDARAERGDATFADVAAYRLRNDAEAAAIGLCGATGHVWFADEQLHWSRVR